MLEEQLAVQLDRRGGSAEPINRRTDPEDLKLMTVAHDELYSTVLLGKIHLTGEGWGRNSRPLFGNWRDFGKSGSGSWFVSAGGFVGLEGGLGAGPVSRVGAPEGVDRFGYGVAADAADGGFLRFFGEFSVAFRKNGAAGFRRIPGDLRDFLRFSSISEKIYRIKCAPARAPARARMCVRVYPISRRAEKRRKLGIIIVAQCVGRIFYGEIFGEFSVFASRRGV